MLSVKDKEFITYWETERERLSSFQSRLLSGLPMAVLFCIPVLLFITCVYLFFPEWYTKVSDRLPGSMITIVIALVICVVFFSYFRMQYKWENNEQIYRELKSKEHKIENHSE